jgi:SAM-dependent methyltransferase
MIAFDPASFRDPSGRLFRHDGAIFRTASPEALARLHGARTTGLLDDLEQQGLFVPITIVRSEDAGLSPADAGEFVIRQAQLPLVTYSYEWSFSMLRAAALVTLRALESALKRGYVLKDATSFNVVFDGTVPRLVDVHSLEPRKEGTLWAGYAQFCRAFLFPLFMTSYRGMDARPLLLSGLGEIPVDVVAPLFRLRDRLKPGVLTNVVIQASLERRFGGRAEDVGKAGASIKYPVSAVVAQVGKLRSIVEKLPLPSGDAWTTYVETHTYDDEGVKAKEGFVRAGLETLAPATVLDLGTNTGQYARLARATGARVVAVDISAASIDALYRKAGADTNISPLVADLTKPTPPVGWRLIERKALLDRLRGDFGLALALIHHLRITGGIPLSEVLGLLTSLTPAGVIEWVGRDDSMVKRLLALRPDVYDDYTQPQFEALLGRHARIESQLTLPGGQRTLYLWSRER